MNLLARYLIRQNCFLLFAVLFIGIGIYLLADMFERIDNLIESGLGFAVAIKYFALKIPMIISQILPAVFLLATIVQFAIMSRNKELVAINSGGISVVVVAKYIFIWGVFLAAVQFSFSQYIGVQGDRLAAKVWKEEIKGKKSSDTIQGIWFTEKEYVIHVYEIYPSAKKGFGFLAYKLSKDNKNIEQMIIAEKFTAHKDHWLLQSGQVTTTASFTTELFPTMELKITQDLDAFLVANSQNSFSQHNFGELGAAIERLQSSGSNVEGLKTAWHNKISYASSIAIVGLLALCIVITSSNVYIGVGKGLIWIFALYISTSIVNDLGSNAHLPPVIAVWLPNLAIISFCLFKLNKSFRKIN